MIQAGEKLFQEFLKLKELVTDFMENCAKTGNPRLSEKENELKETLRNFDVAWITYEQYYVYELMVIETDSRRFIINSIKIEKELQRFEEKSNLRGEDLINNPAYNAKREELISQLSQINSVCNMTGKGRDDLTEISILRAAEEVPNDLLVGQAQSIQVLAEKIRSSIQCFRLLLQKYRGNMDAVDPQLKNNQELIQIVELYETSWAAGKEQLLDKT